MAGDLGGGDEGGGNEGGSQNPGGYVGREEFMASIGGIMGMLQQISQRGECVTPLPQGPGLSPPEGAVSARVGEDAPGGRPGKEKVVEGNGRDLAGRELFPSPASAVSPVDLVARVETARPLARGSPFCELVLSAPVPEGFREPEMIYYVGKDDPLQHLQWFEDAVSIRPMTDAFKCRLFAITLKDKARDWFHQLPAGSIYGFEDLSRSFQLRFSTSKKRKKNPESIFLIKQKADESLAQYVDRFQEEILDIQEVPGFALQMAFTVGLREGFFKMSLTRKAPLSFEGLMEKAAKEIAMEAANPAFAKKLARLTEVESREPGGAKQQEGRRREEPRGPAQQELAWRQPGGPVQGQGRGLPLGGRNYYQGGPGRFQQLGWGHGPRPLPPPPQQAMAIGRGRGRGRERGRGGIGAGRRRNHQEGRQEGEVATPFCDFHEEEGGTQIRVRGDPKAARECYVTAVNTISWKGDAEELEKRMEQQEQEENGVEELGGGIAVEPVMAGELRVGGEEQEENRVEELGGGIAVEPVMAGELRVGGEEQEENRVEELGGGIAVEPVMAGKQEPGGGEEEVGRKKRKIGEMEDSPLGRGSEAVGERFRREVTMAVKEGAGGGQELGRQEERLEREERTPIDQEEEEEPSRLRAAVEVREMNILTKEGREEKIKVSGELGPEDQEKIRRCVQENIDIFAWSAADMPGIDADVACHRLNLDPQIRPIQQKKRAIASRMAKPIREEVEKLLQAGFISANKYPGWDVTFITEDGCFSYNMMPFGLKNAGATYQRMMDRIFRKQKGRNLEVYVDDLMIKSQDLKSHIADLEETFGTIRKYKMRLNPLKCVFGASRGKFLGHLLTPSGVEPNPDKVKAILELESPTNTKEVQRLTVTDHPLRRILEGVEHSGRLAKWSIELSEFDLSFVPRMAVKAQVVADFLVDYVVEVKEAETSPVVAWEMLVDGASGRNSFGGGMVLTSPEGTRIEQALRVHFTLTNNQAEYEAIIAGLRLARELGIQDIKVFTDSMLVAGHIRGEFEVREATLQLYLTRVKGIIGQFRSFSIQHVPREENTQADLLAKHGPRAGGTTMELFRPSIEEGELMEVDHPRSWMDPITTYLMTGRLPEGELEKKHIRYKSAYYLLKEGVLYRKTLSGLLARCISEEEVERVLEEIHSGECGSHSGSRTLEGRVLRQGYFWPTLRKDAEEFARRCRKCQEFAPLQLLPAQRLRTITAPWPFAIWGLDLKKVENLRGNWVEQLPSVLWALRTTPSSATGETPFKLSHGSEAVIPIEFEVESPRVVAAKKGDEEWLADNEEEQRLSLDLVEESRNMASIRQEEVKRRMSRYFDRHVRVKQFERGDLVLKKVDAAGRGASVGKLNPNWEGPFIVKEVLKSGGYHLQDVDGAPLDRARSGDDLKRFYP
ncbi:hypothetical protein KSP39_PZI022731 [Platanthera zijinensis]|uniref:RNase H type-1 domain-containing protein n=1 Tax=Platanthera zijinensis TaxID=2320716 RepID=A0AAP0FUG6_9ASPA